MKIYGTENSKNLGLCGTETNVSLNQVNTGQISLYANTEMQLHYKDVSAQLEDILILDIE